MMYSTMSVMGLYNFDPTLFDGLQIPAALNREALIEELVMRLSSLEILYPNPDILKRAIKNWSTTRIADWERIYTALTMEYNPIHNYDRNESYMDTVTEDGTGESASKNNGEDTNSQHMASYNDTTSLPETQRNVASYGSGSEATGKTHNDRTIKHEANISGNIGVTTSQQMIESELALRRNDMYNIIINEFKGRFCLLVY